MSGLVLSLFPGVGLLDRAFEEDGFCVVRGPDLLWGGDISLFHPPSGRFDGVIGGPPCQAHSRLSNLVRHVYGPEKVAECRIPEFERCIAESGPAWFLMEMVPEGPLPRVDGFEVHSQLLRDVWVGGETSRLRRFSFGTRDGRRLLIQVDALCRPDPQPAVLASGGRWVPVAVGASGKVKRDSKRRRPEKKVWRKSGKSETARVYGAKTNAYLKEAIAAQGLPDDFDLPGMTVAGKIKAVGNGVPLAMGRAVAKAVRLAIEPAKEAEA